MKELVSLKPTVNPILVTDGAGFVSRAFARSMRCGSGCGGMLNCQSPEMVGAQPICSAGPLAIPDRQVILDISGDDALLKYGNIARTALCAACRRGQGISSWAHAEAWM